MHDFQAAGVVDAEIACGIGEGERGKLPGFASRSGGDGRAPSALGQVGGVKGVVAHGHGRVFEDAGRSARRPQSWAWMLFGVIARWEVELALWQINGADCEDVAVYLHFNTAPFPGGVCCGEAGLASTKIWGGFGCTEARPSHRLGLPPDGPMPGLGCKCGCPFI